MLLIGYAFGYPVTQPDICIQEVKKFLLKFFRCMDEPIKRMGARLRREHTRRLPYYSNMVVKKRQEDYHTSVACTCNKCRVVFVSCNVVGLPIDTMFL